MHLPEEVIRLTQSNSASVTSSTANFSAVPRPIPVDAAVITTACSETGTGMRTPLPRCVAVPATRFVDRYTRALRTRAMPGRAARNLGTSSFRLAHRGMNEGAR
jgi:hypothetical protein